MNTANLNDLKNDSGSLKQYCGLLVGHQRRIRQWSQESLAHGICSVSYLSKIESAQCVPSQEILTMLAEKMGVSASRFFVLDRPRRPKRPAGAGKTGRSAKRKGHG